MAVIDIIPSPIKKISRVSQEWSGVTSNKVPWSVLCGDASERLAVLPDNSYDCVVTSPPYFSLRDYGVDGQIGLEETVDGYVASLNNTMVQVNRVLKPTGLLFLNLGDTYYSGKGMSHGIDKKSNKRRFGVRPVDKSGGLGIGIRPKSAIGVPWRVALEMMQQGWRLRSTIIWHRPKALPEAVQDRPRRSYEYIFMFSKERFYYFDRESLDTISYGEDVWAIPARPKATNGIDTAPFPDELVEQCLQLGCPPEGRVLDPFAGSGTTLRVAVGTGRSATGIDLHPKFCEYMVERLSSL